MAAAIDAIDAVLGPDGLLARAVDGFAWREQQQAMAEQVAAAIDTGGTLICEAGTGTGKTYAYLVPALLSARKVIVATGTRNLQDQLFHRDLPALRRSLQMPVQVALLKGRGNYLCRHRLQRAVDDVAALRPEVRRDLSAVRDWASVTRRGDIAEVGLAEDAAVWASVTSTTDNCLGQDCPEWQRCHLVDARRRAQEADLVVINHHLLCADMVLREEGFGEVLPGADAVIVDEAHQLPDIASQFFGNSLSSRQLLDLARDLAAAQRADAADTPQLRQSAAALTALVPRLRSGFGAGDRRGAWHEIDPQGEVAQGLVELADALEETGEILVALAPRSADLAHCRTRATGLAQRLQALLDDAGDAAEHGADSGGVRWFELRGQGFRLHQTPLDVAEVFRSYRARRDTAWVYTSATLAVGDSFAHFSAQVGAEDAATERWDSPFDYTRQALLFTPPGMPEPGAADYDSRVAEAALEVIALSRGRAFCLFTSHRALRLAAAHFEGRLDYPLLVQGQAPRAELIDRFRRLGDAVLLGTASFWEGVDVRGEALSCVIIDRLPFASPGDPLLQGRIEALRRRGRNPFREFQLPKAVIALKQGAGRLIRDPADRGVLVLCDPRLRARSYGQVFFNSLPPMTRTRDLAAVQAFFAMPTSM
ncbi:MAG: ATP-dependent DNA helicase [Thiohalocapsa sp.]|jgi:ATP-dependent DNA helicase DinG|uniref:ATP-dependent DNA helicase n=1 Tax=Thiohalocapsa sp. TaxID=2497641 RepID=UPI0025DB20C2|nr:ATP-dependent DNA helicase [Thiohalocapsa sp.]MCG6941717.1 ATP-dependent DNA helicase [Thiohalocapsa sp.]